MDKSTVPGLFVNDGSFLERFKQLQQEKDKKSEALDSSSKSVSNTSLNSAPKTVIAKTKVDLKRTTPQDTARTSSGGKLAFSLKQKSKLVSPPVKFVEDEDKEDGNSSDDVQVKRAKLDQMGSSEQSSKKTDNVPPSPSDPIVKKVADKLASFVAKNGRQFEDVTRQKNPGDTPFKFLYDNTCSDYKYYEYRLSIEEKELAQTRESQSSQNDTAPHSSCSSQKSHHQQPKYQTPASALHETSSEPRGLASTEEGGKYGDSVTLSAPDPIAMMEYYMKKAAQEEKRRPPKASKDEMPPPESFQTTKKGHHMGDYIPPEELEKFLATCNDVSAQKYAKEYAERAKIQADNVGHRLLSKMGWKEGEGLGSSRSGIADPIMAGDVKKDNLGVGAHAPGEVTPDDDIYEQYKKRMMLGYRHRPNPLNNPRKAYY